MHISPSLIEKCFLSASDNFFCKRGMCYYHPVTRMFYIKQKSGMYTFKGHNGKTKCSGMCKGFIRAKSIKC